MLGKIFRKPQYFSLEISGPKVVKNVRCNVTGGPFLYRGPGCEPFSLTSLLDDQALLSNAFNSR